ncbi:MAG: hypothetical protein H0W83_14890, partial [Planctomycetes bacterium]|nr:hypothetical protein [Planctomycetota bacterium]
MDGNGILLWVAGIALVLTAIQAANRSRADARELLVVCSVILVAAAVCWLWAPAIAGYVAAGGYAVAIVCPALLTVAFQGALDRRRWISARALSWLLLVLRPTAGMRSFTAMGLAAAEAETGDIEAAQQLLAPAEGASEAARRAITVMRLHVAQRWDELLAVIDAIDPEERDRDPMLAMYRLRALGEVGRIDEIAHEYRTLGLRGRSAIRACTTWCG